MALAILSVLPVCEWNIISTCAIEGTPLDSMGPEAVSGFKDPGRIAPLDAETIFRDFRRLVTGATGGVGAGFGGLLGDGAAPDEKEGKVEGKYGKKHDPMAHGRLPVVLAQAYHMSIYEQFREIFKRVFPQGPDARLCGPLHRLREVSPVYRPGATGDGKQRRPIILFSTVLPPCRKEGQGMSRRP
jgi:hypothetical protein